MKPQNLFLLFSLVLISFEGRAQSDAVNYLSSIGTEYQNISKETMSYMSAVNHGKSARKVEKRRQELLLQIKESEKNVRRMKPFNSDSKLRDSVASYFKMNAIILNEDYGKILNLEEIAEQSYDAMEAYLMAREKAGDKMEIALKSAATQYDLFAANNNIKLVESESKLGTKLKAVSAVNGYHTVVYLIFFKSFKDEAYLMEAMSKGDVNAMEQTRNALLTTSTEGLEKLKEVKTFNNDLSLRNACAQALNFQKTEAASLMPKFIEFQLKKENFEKMQKAIEAKRPADRKQEDIDKFNKEVIEFNKAVKEINALNDDTNKKRNTALKQWNDGSSAFLDKHTP